MTTVAKRIFKEAVKLPAIDRAELIEQILSSFNFPERAKIDDLWAKEAESRLSAFSAGHIKAKPAALLAARLSGQEVVKSIREDRDR